MYGSQGQEKEFSRPKSKTKLEKDKENMKKQKTKLVEKEITEISLSSSKTDDEKELLTELTESESNSSSNWITESELTVSGSGQQTVSESDDSQVVVINESDDSQVVVIPSASSEEDSNRKSKEGGIVAPARREKSSKEVRNKNERPRGNIPSSTAARPYLRSHSGSWRNLRKPRQSKLDKICPTLPSEEPFQVSLAPSGGSREKEGGRTRDGRGVQAQVVELPRISDSQDNGEPSSPPPAPAGSTSSSSLPAPPASGRISRSIENVISKLDRRSMSVLPHIGKTPSEGKAYLIWPEEICFYKIVPAEEERRPSVSSRASSADRSAEKRTISMTFPYTPLRYRDLTITLQSSDQPEIRTELTTNYTIL